MNRDNGFGWFAGITASAIWGGMYVVSKVVLEVIPPFALLTLRLVLGGTVLWAFVIKSGKLNFTKKEWGQVLYLGMIGLGVSLGMQFVGTKLSTASNGAVITSSTPTFIFLFSLLILKERITLRRWAALGVSTLGVFIVLDIRNTALASELFVGNLFLVGAGITWAYYSVLVRKATRNLDTLRVSFGAFLGGLFIGLPFSIFDWGKVTMESISIGIVLGVLYLGIISTALAFYLWNKAFELLEAGQASLTFFAQPVFGTLLGAWFLDEIITFPFVIGGVLVGIGIWISAGDVS